MNTFLLNLLSAYGTQAVVAVFLGVFLAVLIIWSIVHFISESGEKVSIARGLIEYTKRKRTVNPLPGGSEVVKEQSIEDQSQTKTQTTSENQPINIETIEAVEEDVDEKLSCLRTRHKLRSIMTHETGRPIREIPGSTYFYTLQGWLALRRKEMHSEFYNLCARAKSYKFKLEVHKSEQAECYLIVFASGREASNVSKLDGQRTWQITVTDSWHIIDFSCILRIPVSRIRFLSERTLDYPEGKEIAVLDLSIQ